MTDNDRIVERADGMYLEAVKIAAESRYSGISFNIQHDVILIGSILGKDIMSILADIAEVKEKQK